MKPSLLERSIAAIAPTWALNRARSKMAWRALNDYESDRDDRLKRTRRQGASPDQRNQRSAVKMREESRWLEETHDIAKGTLDVLEANIIGAGIFPEPQIKHTDGTLAVELNDQLRLLFDEWMHSPEVTGQFDYGATQSLMVRAWFRDGEIFAQHLIGDIPTLDHQTQTPYSLEMLEADFVPYDLQDDKKGIFQGIEMNAWGRPRAYHVYKQHPGDGAASVRGWGLDTKRVPAERVMHLKRTTRFHATRGLSEFATVLSRFGDLKEIDESERVAARVAAAMTAYIKKGTPDMYDKDLHASTGVAQAARLIEISPGMVFDDLKIGEDVGIIQNNRPNNNLIQFRNSQLASVAAGTSTSAAAISKNYEGSYSSKRQELVDQYAIYRRLSGIFIMRACQPVWDNFITANIAARLIKITGDIDKKTIYDVQHTPPAMPWIDPVKEAAANDLLERRRFKSRTAIIREMRQNPDQVNREIERDIQERKRLNILQEGESEPGVMASPGNNADEKDDSDDGDGSPQKKDGDK